MRAGYIKRHDQAVKLIQKAVTKGSQGNCYMIMDAGKAEDLPTTVQAKRLPAELRPTATDQEGNELITAEDWAKSRPDLLLIPGMLATETPTSAQKLAITIIEVGYCSDTNHAVKRQEKAEQHKQLVRALQAAGHTVTYHLITLGTTGTIPTSTLTTLTNLGIATPQATRTLTKLHLNAVACADNLIRMRRVMERLPAPS